MMRYLLTEHYRLRGWLFNLYMLEDARTLAMTPLSVAEFGVLSHCDGICDLSEYETDEPEERDALIARFVEEGVIGPCDEASVQPVPLTLGQAYRFHPCWLFRRINWAVTGRCNYNCRHCFAAADSHPTVDEPTLEQCLGFVDQVAECGIGRIWITGGEPLMRPDMLQITAAIAKRGIILEDFGTNGALISNAFLDELEAQGHHPQFNVSFDGVGYHDWMRGVKDAEKRTLAGIRLLKSRGYQVMVQCCLCQENLGALRETVEMLAGLGVDRFRVIRTVESTRWMETSPEMTLSPSDHYEAMLDFADWYLLQDIPMELDIWGVLQYNTKDRFVRLVPPHDCNDRKERTQAICGDARNMPFIGSDGRLSLCNQISGYQKSAGIDWGNVYETPLVSLLQDSPFLDQLLCTWGKVRAHNPECEQCEWRHYCNCGCRAVALATTGDIMGKDITNCIFFKDGYYDRYCKLISAHGLK